MALAGRTLGAATAVGILAAITMAARLGGAIGPERPRDRLPSEAALFCAGVRTRAEEPGVVCAASRASFLHEAVRAGLAPPGCAAAALPERASAGSLLILEERGPACAVVGVGRLPAAAAMICGARLEINSASEAELALLPGIGEVRAKGIAESRRRDGPFPDVESLDRVRGIGPKTVELLRPWIAAGAEK